MHFNLNIDLTLLMFESSKAEMAAELCGLPRWVQDGEPLFRVFRGRWYYSLSKEVEGEERDLPVFWCS